MTDAGRGIDLLSGLNRLDGGDAEAELAPHLDQQGGGAAAAIAEDEIIADDGMTNAQPLDQDGAHEILGAARRQGEIETQAEQDLDAELPQELSLDSERGQAEGQPRRLKDAARMRL